MGNSASLNGTVHTFAGSSAMPVVTPPPVLGGDEVVVHPRLAAWDADVDHVPAATWPTRSARTTACLGSK